MLRGLLGVVVLLLVAYALSFDRKRIDWKLVGGGLLMQLVLALAILHLPFISHLLEGCGKLFVKVMDFTDEGLVFLLGPYASKANGFSFLLHSLPVVVFFSALVSICYYWGIIQRVVGAIAWLLRKFMNISGAEGLVSAGNIFMGMTESPVMIKRYLPTMTKSELFLVMVAGMGTIAGTVMGTYISMLGGTDPAQKVLFATHLFSASIMAVPGSIVMAKMICPQTEQVRDLPCVNSDTRQEKSVLEAIANGTATGVKLMTNIAALLLVFISLVAFANYVTEGLIGRYTGLNDWIVEVTDGKATGLTFQFILGVVTAPLMWLIGVPSSDIMLVGSLLGQKTILNEFVAYFQLQQWKDAGLFLFDKSIIMSTYILCGFANISSIGILLGGLGVLAPERKGLIARLGMPAMIGGALVSLLSATLIGMIIG
ncbi:MAG: NupC/NupG family nucleoside CNT transporter [Parabacteroides sp.]